MKSTSITKTTFNDSAVPMYSLLPKGRRHDRCQTTLCEMDSEMDGARLQRQSFRSVP